MYWCQNQIEYACPKREGYQKKDAKISEIINEMQCGILTGGRCCAIINLIRYETYMHNILWNQHLKFIVKDCSLKKMFQDYSNSENARLPILTQLKAEKLSSKYFVTTNMVGQILPLPDKLGWDLGRLLKIIFILLQEANPEDARKHTATRI